MPSDLPAVTVPSAVVTSKWELAAKEIEEALQQQLVVGFLGSASSGKDAAIRALFGVDFGEIDPIPGSTDRVRAVPLDKDKRVIVVNAPGFGDLRADVEQAARTLLDKLDVVVYLVNADGGATIDEKRDLDAIRSTGKPTLVAINKIDLIRPHQMEAFIEATLAQLGVERDEAVVTAFDPLPALSPEPIGVDATIAWIYDTLDKQGKALLFAKQLAKRAVACEPIIRAAAKRAAVAGAIPVPGVDMTAVTAVQVKLISDIAAVYGVRMDKEAILFVLGEVLSGASKGFIRWAVEALKGAGWIPGGQFAHIATSTLGATLASATTFGVGRAAIVYMERRGEISGKELRDAFDVAATSYRRDHLPDDVIDVVAEAEE